MSASLQNLHRSIERLEKLIEDKILPQDEFKQDEEKSLLKKQVEQLAVELIKSKEDYLALKETSSEVINELNNSIQVIDDFFKRYNDVNSQSKNT